jgi:hypothetical protein
VNKYEALNVVVKRFEYRSERGDAWRIMNTRGSGPLKGDCEDFSLTVLWLAYNRKLFPFLSAFLTGRAKMWFAISPYGDKHNVLELAGAYLDNIEQVWGSREYYKRLNYKFIRPHSFIIVLARLITGKLT